MATVNPHSYTKKYNCVAVLALRCLLSSVVLFASINSSANEDIVSFDAGYFEDIGSKYSFNEVVKPSSDALFKRPGKNGLSFGWVEHPYWYKVRVEAKSTIHETVMLDIPWPLLDTLDVYITDASRKLIQAHRLGDHRPFSTRPVSDSHFVIPLDIKNEPVQVIYFNVSTTSSMQLPLTFYSEDGYRKSRAISYTVQGIFYGLLFVMVFYNLFIYLATRRIAYLHYVGFVISFGILQSGLKGSGFQFIWPNIVSLNDFSIATGGAFSLLFLTLFSRLFLQLDEVNSLKKVNNIMLAISFGFIFLSFIVSYKAIITPLAIVVIVSAIIVIIFAILRYRQGFKDARYYLLAWLALVIGCITYLSKQLGFLPINFITEHSLQIGSTMEIILLSFALADRLNSLDRSLKQVNLELEQQVEDRTSKLTLALEELEKANNKLSFISVTDSLTGLHNRYHFDLTLKKEINRIKRNPETICLLLIDIDHFKQVNDTWGHIVGDRILQFVSRILEQSCQRPEDFVCRYGGEEFAIVLPGTSFEGAFILAERMRQLVEKSEYTEKDIKISLTISIGISASNIISTVNSEHLLKAADIALYNAKADGRNCVRTLDQELDLS